MAQRLGRWLRAHDEGAATAEFAVVLPAVVVMVALLLYTARACVVQLECQDAAAVARQLVVLDGDVAAARASAGAGVHVAVAGEANRYVVTTTCRVVSDPLHVIPGSVHGNAVGMKQDGQA
ncbi:pilus assembly protein [Bifidobacterium pseudolongum]|uniref:TadE/TadG family type IV pilus assembly protein n=1 Tax=Bifidobacterium pseudolongum TaxID=1694 RepID=UPI001CE1FAF9|nr:TadE/TadG family type IV pilus assembly protein [Bifidobacterium pseudolongum]UBY94305.1 pilus assembly protein [Bifidobacterium pseudolongum]